jgi:hypothetical protein
MCSCITLRRVRWRLASELACVNQDFIRLDDVELSRVGFASGDDSSLI